MKQVDLATSCILIVDDQQANVDLLQQILEMQGYRNVISTIDPREVMPIYTSYRPDLVLLDLHMPHMTGLEIIEQLRGLGSGDSYLPILVLTADITPDSKRQALHIGANDFLSKPFDVVEVLLRVRNLLETRALHLQVQNHNRLLEDTVRERTSALVATQKELVRKNEELCLALTRASEASELKSQFLANINHEIRTPINGILGMINLLEESQLNAEQQEHTEMLKSSADWLVKVMNDILDVSQLGSGKAKIEDRAFDPRVIMDDLAAVYRNRAHAKGLTFTSSVPQDIPRLLAGDSSRLRRILDQLLSNAIKFTDSGRISVGAELCRETPTEVDIKFIVEDTGVGITPGQLNRLFEPFVQGDGSATRNHGGIGLGLTLAKQLVELLGGEIGLDSTAAAGTKAWFTVAFQKIHVGDAVQTCDGALPAH